MLPVRRTDVCSCERVITGTECSSREHVPPTAVIWIILQAIDSQLHTEITSGVLENNLLPKLTEFSLGPVYTWC